MSLAIDYDTLRREVGRKLSWPRDPDDWDETQAQDVEDILASGLRQFYWPVTDGDRHAWSFLRPAASLSTSAGTRGYDLPTDFGGMVSPGFAFAVGAGYGRIALADEAALRSLAGANHVSGVPRYFAIQPKAVVEGDETQYEVLFYPVPDATYSLSYRYAVSPPRLSEDNPYPLGGPLHAETVRAACLKAAEATLDDGEGVHAKAFHERLLASIAIDKEMSR
jgi:hypothetical protein